MTKVEIEAVKVRISLSGWDKIFALRGELEFDRNSIIKVYAKPHDLKRPMWRNPGTFLPRVIVAGRFHGKGRNEFWNTRYKEVGIVFDLEGEEFDRVVLDVVNAGELIAELG